MVTAPLPSMFDGRDSSRTTWSCWSWSSAASSMVTMRSSVGMNDDSTLRVVVLPAPVPPETTTLSRPRTQASRKSAVARRQRAELDQVVDRQRVGGELADGQRASRRSPAAGRRRSRGCRREDGRRPSGEDSSTRRPMRETILSIVRRRWASSLNVPSTLVSRPLALEPDVERAVDHDLGDVVVAQVGLERAVAEDVVGDLLGDPLPVGRGQRAVAGGHHVGEHAADLGLELGLRQVGVVQLRAELVQQLVVDALLEVVEPALRRRPGRCASAPARPSWRGAGTAARAARALTVGPAASRTHRWWRRVRGSAGRRPCRRRWWRARPHRVAAARRSLRLLIRGPRRGS